MNPESLRELAPFVVRHDDREILLRPFQRSDAGRAQRAYQMLSGESKLNRFWQMTRNLQSDLAEKLTDTDEQDHVGWIALPVSGGETEEFGADFPGFGGVSYWRDPHQPDQAEFSITILDDWQRRGLGVLLFSILYFEGWNSGLRKYIGYVRPANHAVCEWWQGLGGTVVSERNQFCLTMAVDDPAVVVARVSFDLHAGRGQIDLAMWLSQWQEMLATS